MKMPRKKRTKAITMQINFHGAFIFGRTSRWLDAKRQAVFIKKEGSLFGREPGNLNTVQPVGTCAGLLQERLSKPTGAGALAATAPHLDNNKWDAIIQSSKPIFMNLFPTICYLMSRTRHFCASTQTKLRRANCFPGFAALPAR